MKNTIAKEDCYSCKFKYSSLSLSLFFDLTQFVTAWYESQEDFLHSGKTKNGSIIEKLWIIQCWKSERINTLGNQFTSRKIWLKIGKVIRSSKIWKNNAGKWFFQTDKNYNSLIGFYFKRNNKTKRTKIEQSRDWILYYFLFYSTVLAHLK